MLVLVGAPRTCKKFNNYKLRNYIDRLIIVVLGSQCTDDDGGYAILKPDALEAPEGYILNFSCFTNLQTTYPRWEINGQEYDVTDLPPDFNVSGPNVMANIKENAKIRCFVKTNINATIHRVYSNEATVMRADAQG